MMILIYILILITMISLILLNLNFLISKKKNINREKISSFECGFDPLNSSRMPFSINFFMIAILFLIFDIEIVFLLPLVNYMMFLNLNEWLYLSLMILMILFWGLEYEKFEGSLKWIF